MTNIFIDQLNTICQELKSNGFPDITASAIKNIYMPRLIRYYPISHSAKVVAVELLDRFNLDTGRCDLSRTELSGFLKTSKSTISDAIKELEETNILIVKRAARNNGVPATKVSNQYGFNWDLLRDKTQWSHGASCV
jgi:hypothetical protein